MPDSAARITNVDAWAEAARAGDREAFVELYRVYHSPTWQRAYRLVRDRASADDVTQDAWMRILTGLPSFDPARGSFAQWAYRIVYNTAITYLRSVSMRPAREVTAHMLAYGPGHEASGPGPEDIAVTRSVNADVAAIVNALPRKQRDALLLTEFDGLSTRDAAAIIGVTEGALKALKFRAVKTLRANLVSNRNASAPSDVVVMDDHVRTGAARALRR